MDNQHIRKWVLWLTIVVLIALWFKALTIEGHFGHYRYDFIFLMALLILVYVIRDNIDLHWFHYLLFAAFLIMHDLGMFKFYQLRILGLEYDYIAHAFFGLVMAMMLMRGYEHQKLQHSFMKYVMVIIIVLGFSAAHELYEFGGAVTLGEGEGVLFIGAGDLDEWDTQKDMMNNLLGGILGIGGYFLLPGRYKKKKV